MNDRKSELSTQLSSHASDKEEVIARDLIQALNKLLDAGDWDTTLFLKANKKRLLDLRGRAEAVLEQIAVQKATQKIKTREAPPGCKMVYVSLFQAESTNLVKWQNIIKTLEKYSASRPVYLEEEHVRALIRNKADPTKEGYVVTYVREKDIVKPYLGKKIQDRYGHELITLREFAIHLDDIVEFVHANKRYQYSSEKGLILI